MNKPTRALKNDVSMHGTKIDNKSDASVEREWLAQSSELDKANQGARTEQKEV